MKVVIDKPGHRFDGHEVTITHAGINRHPHIDYGYVSQRRELDRPVHVIIMGRAPAMDLLDTFDASELVIKEEA